MHVIVIGAGEVGFDVARMLATEQHDVVVVDIDSDALDHVRERLDVLAIVGNGTSAEVLLEAGVRKADMLIAVAAIDEVNLIACMMADRLGVETKVARVRTGELSHGQSVLNATDFGIDLLIHPEESAGAEVVRLLRRTAATDVVPFSDGQLQLVGMRIDEGSPVDRMSLRDVMTEANVTFRVMGIVRGMRTVLPLGDERIHAKDQLFVLAQPKDVPKVARVLGKNEDRISKIMISGGTRVGAMIALQLSQVDGTQIKLIEPDRERAEQLAERLSDVLVLHGDATDIDLLATEGLGEMDAFVAVTDDEESNLVSCLMAKHLGVYKTVALLSKSAYIPISQTIGLDAAVSKKLAVSREVLRFLRSTHVQSVATVHGLDAEILEIEAKEGAPVTEHALSKLKLPSGMLIGAVLHEQGREVEVATGDTHIRPGDRTIVFVLPKQVNEVERYFAG